MISNRTATARVKKLLDGASSVRPHRIAVIVLTWNSIDHIDMCLESIARSTIPVTTLVVDNASSDGTASHVKLLWNESIAVFETGENLGYAGGNNLGMRIAQDAHADFVVLVNPDAVLALNCIEELVSVLELNPQVGLVCPVICHASTDTVWYAGSDVNDISGSVYHLHQGTEVNLLPSDPFVTGRANGCVIGLCLDRLSEVGFLDERYFLYYEEAEWSLRVRKFGLTVMVVPQARAWHDAGHGMGGASPTYQYYMARNRLLFVSQHGTRGVRAALPQAAKDTALTLLHVAQHHRSRLWPCTYAAISGYFDFFRGRVGIRAR
jgi:GT2 family glycosyltransferase